MRTLPFVLGCLLLAAAPCAAQPAPRPAARPSSAEEAVKPAPAAILPAQPVIKVFSVNPTRLGHREDLVFRWEVEPSRTGSPVTEVKVIAGSIALHTAATPTGTYTFRTREWMYRSVLPPEMHGKKMFVLEAKAAAGATARREVEVEVVSAVPTIESFTVRPEGTVLLGETIRVGWRVAPGPSGIAVTSVLVEEMADGGGGRHSLYTGTDASGSATVRTSASTLPGHLVYHLTVTNQAGARAERDIRVRLARPEDIREKPDLTVEAREIGWHMSGLTPSFRVFLTLNNQGTFRVGRFEYLYVGTRGGSQVFERRGSSEADLVPGDHREDGASFRAEELHGATEVTVILDPNNRIAELDEGNNRLSVPVPPVPR